LMIFL